MTLGNVLYLAMSLGMFSLFSAVLAYESWQQSLLGPDMITDREEQQDTSDEVTA